MLEYFERELKRAREQNARLQSDNDRLSGAETANRYLRTELGVLKDRLRRQQDEHEVETARLRRELKDREHKLQRMSGNAAVEDSYRSVLGEKSELELRASTLERTLRQKDETLLRTIQSQRGDQEELKRLIRENEELKRSFSDVSREGNDRIYALQSANQEETRMLRMELESLRERVQDINTLQQDLVAAREEARAAKERCESIERQNQDMARQSGKERHELQELRERQREMDAYIMSLRREKDELDARLKLSVEKNTALEVETHRAVGHSRKLLQSMEDMAQDDRLGQLKREWEERHRQSESDLANLRTQKDTLARQMRELQNKTDVKDLELNLMQEQLVAARDMLAALQRQEDVSQEKQRQMTTELTGLRLDLGVKRDELEKLQIQHADLRSTNVDLEAQVGILTEKNDALRTDNEHKEKRLRLSEEKLSAALAECESLRLHRQQDEQYREEMALLQRQNTQLSEENETLAEKLHELEESNANIRVQMKVYETRLSDLLERRRTSEEERSQDSVSDLNISMKIDSVEGRMEGDRELILQLQHTVSKLETLLKQRESENKKLQDKVEDMGAKLRVLGEENRSNMSKALERDALEQHMQEMREKCKLLQGELEEATRSRAELKMEAGETEKHAKAMKGELDKALIALSDLRQELQERDQEMAGHDQRQEMQRQELQSLQVQNNVLVEQRQSITEELRSVKEVRDRQGQELVELRAKLEAIRGSIEVHKQQLLIEGMAAEQRVQTMTGEMERQRDMCAQLRKELTDASSQNGVLESERDTLQKRVHSLVSEIDLMRVENERSKEEIIRLSEEKRSSVLEASQVQTLQRDNASMRTQLSNLESKISELEKTNHSLNMHVSVLETKLDNSVKHEKELEHQLHTERSHLKRKNEILQRDLSAQRGEKEQLEHSLRLSEEKMGNLKSQLHELQGKLEELQMQRDEMGASMELERSELRRSIGRQSKSAHSSIHSLQSEITILKDELDTLSKEGEDLRIQKQDMERQLGEFRRSHREAEAEMRTLEQNKVDLVLLLEQLSYSSQCTMQSSVGQEGEGEREGMQSADMPLDNQQLPQRIRCLSADIGEIRKYLLQVRDLEACDKCEHAEGAEGWHVPVTDMKLAAYERHHLTIWRETSRDKKRMARSYEYAVHRLHGSIKVYQDLLEYTGDKMQQILSVYRRQCAVVAMGSSDAEAVVALLKNADAISREQCALGRKLADVKIKLLVNDEQVENWVLERDQLERTVSLGNLKVDLLRTIKEASGRSLSGNIAVLQDLLREGDVHRLHLHYLSLLFQMEHGLAEGNQETMREMTRLVPSVEEAICSPQMGDGEEAEAEVEVGSEERQREMHMDLEWFLPFMDSMGRMLCDKIREQREEGRTLSLGPILGQVIAQETEGRQATAKRRIAALREEIRAGRTQRRDELKRRQRSLTDRIKLLEGDLLACFSKCDECAGSSPATSVQSPSSRQASKEQLDFLMATIDRLQMDLDEKTELLRRVAREQL